MNEFIGRVFSFEKQIFPGQSELFARLTSEGQKPTTLMISCADSRIVPEQIMQAQPGELFVCRNAGNIVPPYSTQNGGVTSTVEYAVMVLGVRDIVVCGHSDCGAMKAVADPTGLDKMPNVQGWLRHSSAAEQVVSAGYGEMATLDRIRAISMENVVAQLTHLRTHPSVASGIARGEIALHGWFVDIHAGTILALDGPSGRFVPLREGEDLPVALSAERRFAGDGLPALQAAE